MASPATVNVKPRHRTRAICRWGSRPTPCALRFRWCVALPRRRALHISERRSNSASSANALKSAVFCDGGQLASTISSTFNPRDRLVLIDGPDRLRTPEPSTPAYRGRTRCRQVVSGLVRLFVHAIDRGFQCLSTPAHAFPSRRDDGVRVALLAQASNLNRAPSAERPRKLRSAKDSYNRRRRFRMPVDMSKKRPSRRRAPTVEK